jgi:hypothetical protein
MKKIYILLMLTIQIVSFDSIRAQCVWYNTNTACTNNAPTVVGGSISCTPPSNNGGRQNFVVNNMVAGCTYRISNCGSGFDTQLTIRNSVGTAVAYNDDNGPACAGLAASVDFVCPANGQYWIQLNRYNCSTINQLNGAIAVTLQGCGPPQNTVPASGSNSYTLCSGVLYDNGGSGGNYTNNANGFTVINPATAGSMVQLTGTINTEFSYDFVRIYNGNGTGGTLLWQGSGVQNIGTITSTSGPLTVQFTSDFSVTYSGFALNIACVTPPPPSPTSITASTTTICAGAGTNVTLNANGASGTVHWFVGLCGTTGSFATGNATVVSPTATTTYYARNFNGSAWSTNCASITIVVNNPPTALSIGASPTNLCAGQQTNLTSSANYSSTIHQAQNETDFLQFITNDTKWVYDFTANAGGTSPEIFFNWTPSSTGLFWAQFGSMINATGYTNLNFQFKHFLDHYSVGYTLRLQTSPDGVTWTDRWTLVNPAGNVGPATVNVPLTALNNSSFFYRFAFDGNSFNTDGWWFDDILITGTPPPVTYSWSSTPAGFTSNSQNTSASPIVNTNYTVTATANGCSILGNVAVSVDQPSVAANGINNTGTYCLGNTVTLSVNGGSLQGSSGWNWYSGGCGGTFVGNGPSITVNPATTTTYFVQATANGACPATTCTSGTVTLPTPNNTLSVNNSTGTCTVNQNGWVHFLDANGRIVASVNSNGQNLGVVTATSYVDNASQLIVPCSGNTNFSTSVLRRHWVITPQFQPTSPVSVRLPVDWSVEWPELQIESQANVNILDDCILPGDVVLSKFAGNNVDDLWTNNCGNGNSTAHTQATNGFINSFLPGFNGVDRFFDFEIPSFSEFWLHGSNSGNSSALPVEMSMFTVTCDAHASKVVWQTQSEINSSHFILEQSPDGTNWEPVVTMQAAQNSSTPILYSANHPTGNNGHYYRLIQVDLDGQFKIYGPITASCTGGNALNESIYPNPSNGDFSVALSNYAAGAGELVLINTYGQTVLRQQINIESDLHLSHVFNHNLANGLYYVFVSINDVSEAIGKITITD